MVVGLLDTNVIVDVLRQYPPAVNWLHIQQNLGVTHLVWLEVLNGVENKRKQQIAIQLLRRFEKVELTIADFEWAIKQTTQYKLSHNIGSTDCLIASVSFRLQLTLYTTNIKHFKPLLGNLAQKPY